MSDHSAHKAINLELTEKQIATLKDGWYKLHRGPADQFVMNMELVDELKLAASWIREHPFQARQLLRNVVAHLDDLGDCQAEDTNDKVDEA